MYSFLILAAIQTITATNCGLKNSFVDQSSVKHILLENPKTNLVSKKQFDSYFQNAVETDDAFEMEDGKFYLVACATKDFVLNSVTPLVEQAAYVTFKCDNGDTGVKYSYERTDSVIGKAFSCAAADYQTEKWCDVPGSHLRSLSRGVPLYSYFEKLKKGRHIVLYRDADDPFKFFCTGDDVVSLETDSISTDCLFSEEFEKTVHIFSSHMDCQKGLYFQMDKLFVKKLYYTCNGLRAYANFIKLVEVESNFNCVAPPKEALNVKEVILENGITGERIVPYMKLGDIKKMLPGADIILQCTKSNVLLNAKVNGEGKYLYANNTEITDVDWACALSCDLSNFAGLSGTLMSGSTKRFTCDQDNQVLNITTWESSELYHAVVLVCRDGVVYLTQDDGKDTVINEAGYTSKCVNKPNNVCQLTSLNSMYEYVRIGTINALEKHESMTTFCAYNQRVSVELTCNVQNDTSTPPLAPSALDCEKCLDLSSLPSSMTINTYSSNNIECKDEKNELLKDKIFRKNIPLVCGESIPTNYTCEDATTACDLTWIEGIQLDYDTTFKLEDGKELQISCMVTKRKITIRCNSLSLQVKKKDGKFYPLVKEAIECMFAAAWRTTIGRNTMLMIGLLMSVM